MRLYHYINANKEDPNKRQFEIAAAYIEANYMNESLNVSALEEGILVSKSFLVKLFKENTGLTPLDYINRFRCEQALAFLECQEYTIEEISKKTGYSNAHTFIGYLKRYTEKLRGHTAMQY